MDEPSYKEWPTPRPSEYNHHKWPSMKMETPRPTHTPRPTWAKTPKPTYVKTPRPTKEPKTPRPTQWQTEKPTKWSSDKSKYSMRYADAAHDYKGWKTEKPKGSAEEPHYEPRYGDKHWEKTPKPTKYTPRPTK